MRVSGAAGIATIGASGVKLGQEALAETPAAVELFVPYLDTLRWVFIGVAPAGYRRRRLHSLGRLVPRAETIGTVVGWFTGSRWAVAVAK